MPQNDAIGSLGLYTKQVMIKSFEALERLFSLKEGEEKETMKGHKNGVHTLRITIGPCHCSWLQFL